MMKVIEEKKIMKSNKNEAVYKKEEKTNLMLTNRNEVKMTRNNETQYCLAGKYICRL